MWSFCSLRTIHYSINNILSSIPVCEEFQDAGSAHFRPYTITRHIYHLRGSILNTAIVILRTHFSLIPPLYAMEYFLFNFPTFILSIWWTSPIILVTATFSKPDPDLGQTDLCSDVISDRVGNSEWIRKAPCTSATLKHDNTLVV